VLSEESSDSEAFLDKGVVDPSKYESTTDRSALGTKLILEDHKGRRIADLIVGSSLNDDDKATKNHFVRVPGQPTVYQVEFNKPSLTTDFTNWVNSDLFGFKQRAAAYAPGVIGIDDYRISLESLASGGETKQNYRAEFEFAKNGMGMTSLARKDLSGEFEKLQLSSDLVNGFASMGRQIERTEPKCQRFDF